MTHTQEFPFTPKLPFGSSVISRFGWSVQKLMFNRWSYSFSSWPPLCFLFLARTTATASFAVITVWLNARRLFRLAPRHETSQFIQLKKKKITWLCTHASFKPLLLLSTMTGNGCQFKTNFNVGKKRVNPPFVPTIAVNHSAPHSHAVQTATIVNYWFICVISLYYPAHISIRSLLWLLV